MLSSYSSFDSSPMSMASKISTSKSIKVKSVSLYNGLETSTPGVVASHKEVSQLGMVEVLMKRAETNNGKSDRNKV